MGIVRQTDVHTVGHELKVSLYRVETCQLSSLAANRPIGTTQIGHCRAVPFTCRTEHLKFVRVAYEVPLQFIGCRYQTVFIGTVLCIVI